MELKSVFPPMMQDVFDIELKEFVQQEFQSLTLEAQDYKNIKQYTLKRKDRPVVEIRTMPHENRVRVRIAQVYPDDLGFCIRFYPWINEISGQDIFSEEEVMIQPDPFIVHQIVGKRPAHYDYEEKNLKKQLEILQNSDQYPREWKEKNIEWIKQRIEKISSMDSSNFTQWGIATLPKAETEQWLLEEWVSQVFFQHIVGNWEGLPPIEEAETQAESLEELGDSKKVVLQSGKPGRPSDPAYDKAYDKIKEGRDYKEVFEEFCKEQAITKPDKIVRDSFKSAMNRRKEKASKRR
jgi:hypothetical protein